MPQLPNPFYTITTKDALEWGTYKSPPRDPRIGTHTHKPDTHRFVLDEDKFLRSIGHDPLPIFLQGEKS